MNRYNCGVQRTALPVPRGQIPPKQPEFLTRTYTSHSPRSPKSPNSKVFLPLISPYSGTTCLPAIKFSSAAACPNHHFLYKKPREGLIPSGFRTSIKHSPINTTVQLHRLFDRMLLRRLKIIEQPGLHFVHHFLEPVTQKNQLIDFLPAYFLDDLI